MRLMIAYVPYTFHLRTSSSGSAVALLHSLPRDSVADDDDDDDADDDDDDDEEDDDRRTATPPH